MLKFRLIMGPVLILLLLGAAWLDEWLDGVAGPEGALGFLSAQSANGTLPPGMVVTPIVALLAVMSAREMTRILRETGVRAAKRFNATAALIGVLLVALAPSDLDGLTGATLTSTAIVGVIAASLIYYSRGQAVQGIIAAAGGALLSFGILGMMLGFVVVLRREESIWVLVWVLLTTKSSDIGAFTVGMTMGKHRMIPWLSPKKTWEGFFGGVVFAALVGMGGALVLRSAGIAPFGGEDGRGTGFVIGVGLVMGAAFAAIGQAGDLLASMLKRDAGRKDSGGSIPGFGGVLDVIDSLLLVGPVAFWALRLLSVG